VEHDDGEEFEGDGDCNDNYGWWVWVSWSITCSDDIRNYCIPDFDSDVISSPSPSPTSYPTSNKRRKSVNLGVGLGVGLPFGVLTMISFFNALQRHCPKFRQSVDHIQYGRTSEIKPPVSMAPTPEPLSRPDLERPPAFRSSSGMDTYRSPSGSPMRQPSISESPEMGPAWPGPREGVGSSLRVHEINEWGGFVLVVAAWICI
jgi:hypothetical protein